MPEVGRKFSSQKVSCRMRARDERPTGLALWVEMRGFEVALTVEMSALQVVDAIGRVEGTNEKLKAVSTNRR